MFCRSLRSVLVFAVLSGVPSGCGGNSAGPASTAEGAVPAQAYSVPDFELRTLEGETIALSDYLGKKVILIDFWATYCAPCIAAMPHLNDIYKKYKSDDFIILGVSVDGPESQGRVRSVARKMKIEFPILLDEETEALALYNSNSSAPYSVLIDKKGNVVKRKEGFDPASLDEFERDIVGAIGSSD